MQKMDANNLKEAVKSKYGEAARLAAEGTGSRCGSGGASACCDPITSNLYTFSETEGLPDAAKAASLGCGGVGFKLVRRFHGSRQPRIPRLSRTVMMSFSMAVGTQSN
jgi:hypothetical protein